MNETILIILIITSIVAIIALTIVLLYTLTLIRRTSIVMKKVDYFVEDLTYKSESLNVAVEAVNKVSTYVLSFDSFAKKSLRSMFKIVSENRNYFYSFADRLKDEVEKDKKKRTETKKTSTSKKTTAKKPAAKKTTAKKTPAKKTTAKKAAK